MSFLNSVAGFLDRADESDSHREDKRRPQGGGWGVTDLISSAADVAGSAAAKAGATFSELLADDDSSGGSLEQKLASWAPFATAVADTPQEDSQDLHGKKAPTTNPGVVAAGPAAVVPSSGPTSSAEGRKGGSLLAGVTARRDDAEEDFFSNWDLDLDAGGTKVHQPAIPTVEPPQTAPQEQDDQDDVLSSPKEAPTKESVQPHQDIGNLKDELTQEVLTSRREADELKMKLEAACSRSSEDVARLEALLTQAHDDANEARTAVERLQAALAAAEANAEVATAQHEEQISGLRAAAAEQQQRAHEEEEAQSRKEEMLRAKREAEDLRKELEAVKLRNSEDVEAWEKEAAALRSHYTERELRDKGLREEGEEETAVFKQELWQLQQHCDEETAEFKLKVSTLTDEVEGWKITREAEAEEVKAAKECEAECHPTSETLSRKVALAEATSASLEEECSLHLQEAQQWQTTSRALQHRCEQEEQQSAHLSVEVRQWNEECAFKDQLATEAEASLAASNAESAVLGQEVVLGRSRFASLQEEHHQSLQELAELQAAAMAPRESTKTEEDLFHLRMELATWEKEVQTWQEESMVQAQLAASAEASLAECQAEFNAQVKEEMLGKRRLAGLQEEHQQGLEEVAELRAAVKEMAQLKLELSGQQSEVGKWQAEERTAADRAGAAELFLSESTAAVGTLEHEARLAQEALRSLGEEHLVAVEEVGNESAAAVGMRERLEVEEKLSAQLSTEVGAWKARHEVQEHLAEVAEANSGEHCAQEAALAEVSGQLREELAILCSEQTSAQAEAQQLLSGLRSEEQVASNLSCESSRYEAEAQRMHVEYEEECRRAESAERAGSEERDSLAGKLEDLKQLSASKGEAQRADQQEMARLRAEVGRLRSELAAKESATAVEQVEISRLRSELERLRHHTPTAATVEGESHEPTRHTDLQEKLRGSEAQRAALESEQQTLRQRIGEVERISAEKERHYQQQLSAAEHDRSKGDLESAGNKGEPGHLVRQVSSRWPLQKFSRQLVASPVWRLLFFGYVAILHLWVLLVLQHAYGAI